MRQCVTGWAEPLRCDSLVPKVDTVCSNFFNPTGANCTQMSTDIHQLTASESNSENASFIASSVGDFSVLSACTSFCVCVINITISQPPSDLNWMCKSDRPWFGPKSHLWDESSSGGLQQPAGRFLVRTAWLHSGKGCFASAWRQLRGFLGMPLRQTRGRHLEPPPAPSYEADSGNPWRSPPALHLRYQQNKTFKRHCWRYTWWDILGGGVQLQHLPVFMSANTSIKQETAE